MRLPSRYVTCCDSPFSHGHRMSMSDARLFTSRGVTWSLPVPTRCTHLRGSKSRSLACVFKISAVGPYFLLFDYQEAFHCCLVVACSKNLKIYSIPARGNRVHSTFKGTLSTSKYDLWALLLYTIASGACSSGTERKRLRREMDRWVERGREGSRESYF